MTWKEAQKLKPGAIVRESWSDTGGWEGRRGLVLALEYEEKKKRELVLGQTKDKRYMVTIHWFPHPRLSALATASRQRQSSWDLMVVSHAK